MKRSPKKPKKGTQTNKTWNITPISKTVLTNLNLSVLKIQRPFLMLSFFRFTFHSPCRFLLHLLCSFFSILLVSFTWEERGSVAEKKRRIKLSFDLWAGTGCFASVRTAYLVFMFCLMCTFDGSICVLSVCADPVRLFPFGATTITHSLYRITKLFFVKRN